MSLRGPPQADRGNLNRYILDCFVVKLLAMTPATQLIRRERLQFFLLSGSLTDFDQLVIIAAQADMLGMFKLVARAEFLVLQ